MPSLKNFDTLSQEEKSLIYNELLGRFSESNLNYFIENKSKFNSLDNSMESLGYKLRKGFNESHWNILISLLDFEKLSSSQNESLEKIATDISKLMETFKKFNLYSSSFGLNVSIAGGAIRDLVLMKEPNIKDLDLVVSFFHKPTLALTGFNLNPKLESRDREMLLDLIKNDNKFLKQNGLREFDIHSIPIGTDNNEAVDKFVFHLVSQFIKKNFLVNQEYVGGLNNQLPMGRILSNLASENKHLSGVIKIKDPSLNYEVDVLLSNANFNDYFRAFDYSLCKMAVCLLENDFDVLEGKENKGKELFQKIIFSPEIYDDILNKKCTFFTENFTREEIERSLNNHFSRLNLKYPEYQLSLQDRHGSHDSAYLRSLELLHKIKAGMNIPREEKVLKRVKV